MNAQSSVQTEYFIEPLPDAGNEECKERKSQATLLVEIAQRATLFTSHEHTPHATITVDGHLEHWPIRSKGFRDWLARQFWQEHGKAVSSQGMNDALNTVEALASYSGNERRTYIRVAEHDGRIYLDLCDPSWRCVEIDAEGWRILERPPVAFVRHARMEPLPTPQSGDINALWQFLNVPEKSRPLIVAWLLMALRYDLPYPVLSLQGGQGSAKSTASKVLRRLIDPSVKDTQAPPRSEDDLFISLAKSHITAIDNLSGIPDWLSDTLCRAATGSAISKRQNYSDADEVIVKVKRPIILNGIDGLLGRQDLISRQIHINLEDIPEESRKQESIFFSELEEAHPRLLGALLDLAAKGLKQSPRTQLSQLPRMADFAHWATACLGEHFLDAYQENIRHAVEEGLGGSPLADAIIKLMEGNSEWRSTPEELLNTLNDKVNQRTKSQKSWPGSERALGRQLARLSTPLQTIGLIVRRSRSGKSRYIIITKLESKGKITSLMSLNEQKVRNHAALSGDIKVTLNNISDINSDVSDIMVTLEKTEKVTLKSEYKQSLNLNSDISDIKNSPLSDIGIPQPPLNRNCHECAHYLGGRHCTADQFQCPTFGSHPCTRFEARGVQQGGHH